MFVLPTSIVRSISSRVLAGALEKRQVAGRISRGDRPGPRRLAWIRAGTPPADEARAMGSYFPNGLPIRDLPPDLQAIARELDRGRGTSRTGADARGDDRIGPSEIQWGLDHLDLFHPMDEAPNLESLG